jgi:hypothetical protein
LPRNYLLKHVIEGKMEGKTALTRILGRRRKQIVDALRKREGTESERESAKSYAVENLL